MIDNEKLKEWAKQIYENACAHGWHEESKPDRLWMCLVMSEVAEAVEADRKHISVNGNIAGFEKLTGVGHDFKTVYKDYVKGSVAEELADVVIRLLDYAYMRWGDKFPWNVEYGNVIPSDNFAVNAFTFVKDVLNYGSMNIMESICYVIEWADQLEIDLVWHIEHKMKYNELRSYKHGGKKY